MTANGTGQVTTIAPPSNTAPQVRIVGKNEDASLQKDMMASMTQFSQVEQMQNMTQAMETISLTQGVGLIGREVEYKQLARNAQGQVTGEITFTGVVDHVKQGGGGIKLVLARPAGVGDDVPQTEISPSDVTRVGAE